MKKRESAIALAESGKVLEAEAAFRAVVEEARSNLGAEHRFTLRNRMGLARLVGDDGNPAEAVKELRAVLPIQVRVLGADDEDTMLTRDSLVVMLHAQGKTSEA